MTALRESPWYNAIVEEGLQQDLQQGLQQGESMLILRQLRKRFGSVDKALQTRIEHLTVAQLEALAESLLDFSGPNDLEAWLSNIE